MIVWISGSLKASRIAFFMRVVSGFSGFTKRSTACCRHSLRDLLCSFWYFSSFWMVSLGRRTEIE